MKQQLQKFIVQGQHALKGTVTVSGSKNAALPILCAALLTDGLCEIDNVPDIANVHTLLEIFSHLKVKAKFAKSSFGNTVTIDASKLTSQKIPDGLSHSLRASILLLGPLLARLHEVDLPFPGGDPIGKRSVFTHTDALKQLGVEVLSEEKSLHLKVKKLQSTKVTLPEVSVTGTENALILAALTPGITELRLVAAEPHVQDLCHFLNKMGAKITGIGTHFLQIEGVKKLNGAKHTIIGDYLEAGTFAIAALVTRGEITVKGIQTGQLESFWQKLEEAGAQFTLQPESFTIHHTPKLQAVRQIRTAVYPSFPTDLQAPIAILLTQAHGTSKIFETLFEGRLNYLFELEKMGANIQMLNPHQATVTGPTELKGVPIASIDIRAGAAMVLAALCAKGTTEISDIKYIDRGYENLDEKLRSLGASIERV